MSDITVKKTVEKMTKNGFEGTFFLSDGSRTQYEFDKSTGAGWMQWGNDIDKLHITVDLLTEKTNRFLMENN